MLIQFARGKVKVEFTPEAEAAILAELGMTASEIRFYQTMQNKAMQNKESYDDETDARPPETGRLAATRQDER